MFNNLSRVLQADWLTLENNEKTFVENYFGSCKGYIHTYIRIPAQRNHKTLALALRYKIRRIE